MTDGRHLVIIGAGGHGREALVVARSTGRWTDVAFVDENLCKPR